MQRQVGLLLAVLALGAPLLSEIHSLGQVIMIFIVVVVVGVVAVRCRLEKREVGLPLEKTKTMRKQL